MAHKTLSDFSVANATSDGKPQADIFDAPTPGLSIRVTLAGKKTWTFNFTSPRDHKQARISLGTYPAISLKAARTLAEEAREHVRAGTDPRDVTVEPVVADKTIKQLIADRLEMEIEGRLRSAAAIKRRYEKNIIPVVGSVAVRAFRISHLNMITDPIVRRGADIEANRVFQDVRALMNFAVRRGEIEFNSMAKARLPSVAVVRERYLTVPEIATVWQMLPSVLAKSDYVPLILKLCLVTAQRLSEVAGMRRDEIDLVNRLWTIPAARSKNKHEHRVPLSDLALQIVREAMRDTNGDFLFPNTSDEQPGPIVANVVDRALSRSQAARPDMPLGKFGIAKWCPHDLRRTAATHMSLEENGLNVDDLIISHVLNHRSVTKGSITKAVYNKNTYVKEKRDALDKWAAFLERVVAGDKVVAIDEARAA